MRVYVSPHTFKMKFNIKSSVDWNWLFHYCFIFYDFKQPIPVWRQTRPSVIFTYVISGPLVQVGMFQGDPNIIFSPFNTSLCVKPGVDLILASMIFARPENCSSLGLYFLFSFLNGRHLFWLRTSCYTDRM